MARHATGFSTDTPGAAPDGWTHYGAGASLVEVDTALEDGMRLRLAPAATAAYARAIWTAAGSLAAPTIYVRGRLDTLATSIEDYLGVLLAYSHGAGTGYFVNVRRTGSYRVQVGRVVGGSTVPDADALLAWDPRGVWWHLVVQHVPNPTTPSASLLRVRAWTGEVEDDPGTWQATATGTPYAAYPSGAVGLLAWSQTTAGALFYADTFEAVTGADDLQLAAPVPPWYHDLTLFGDDDETPVLGSVDGAGAVTVACFSTDPAHPRPFLDTPENHGEASVDFQQGRATLGRATFTVLDRRRTAADQASGLLTYHLADADGETARIGRRALWQLRRGGRRLTVLDGPLSEVELLGDLASFRLAVRDTNENARRTRLFDRTGTTAVYPRGVVAGYGLRPDGTFMAPPVAPLVGTYTEGSHSQGITGRVTYAELDKKRVPPERVITDATHAALRDAQEPAPAPYIGHYRWPLVDLWWRPVGGGAWNVIAAPWRDALAGNKLSVASGRTKAADGTEHSVQFYTSFAWLWNPTLSSEPRPANGAQVEFLIVYTGPASAAYPFHFEGTHGELIRNVLRGDYSARAGVDASGLPIPYTPRVRYDESALVGAGAPAVMQTPARLRITEPVADAREWLEKVFQAIGAAPALDEAGRVAPVAYEVPGPDVDLATLDDTKTIGAEWLHSDRNAVNVVRLTYPRDYPIPPAADPAGSASAGDGIGTREVVAEYRNEASVAKLGERRWELKPVSLRALGNEDQQPISGDVADETAYQVARERARQALNRLLYGGQALQADVLRSAFPDLRPGDWVMVELSWLPDYRDRTRGTFRLAQVLGVRDSDPITRRLTLLDAGPNEQPLAAPTVGSPTAAADGVVSLPVVTVPAGAEGRVDYAVAASVPAASSGEWIFADAVAAGESARTAPVPAGATVWLRARSEAPGRRPSEWTTPSSVVAPQRPRVWGIAATVAADGTASVTWTANAYALGVRARYDYRAAEEEPVLGSPEDFSGAGGVGVLAQPWPAGVSLTVELTAYPGWTGTAVSGTAGDVATITIADPRLDSTPWVASFDADHTPAGSITWEVAFNRGTTLGRVLARLGSWPTDDGTATGRPDPAFRKTDDITRDTAEGVFPVVSGTYYLIAQAIGADGEYHTAALSVVVSGVPGGSNPGTPTEAPGAVAVRQSGLGAGSTAEVVAAWEHTLTAHPLEVRWYADGALAHTETVAQPTSAANRSFAVGTEVWAVLAYDDGTTYGPTATTTVLTVQAV